MSRPSFLEGSAVALTASVVGGGAFVVLAPTLGSAVALRAVAGALGFAYLLYLLMRSGARVGRAVAPTLWLGVSAAMAILDASLGTHVVVQAGLVWLTRSLWFHSGILAALADLALVVAGLAAAAWAVDQSASLSLAIWCLMLVQAGFIAIPSKRAHGETPSARTVAIDDPFERAHRAALSAVQRLSTAI